MFWHNFRYTLKVLLHDHALIFWTFAFPIILGTLFFFAFSSITSNETLDLIDIAVVDDQEWQDATYFREAFTELSSADSEHQLFSTEYVSRDAAEQLLSDDAISGYVLLEGGEPRIFTNSSNIDSTILKVATENITDQADVFATVAREHPEDLAKLAHANAARLIDQSGDRLDYTMVEYYTLIAMACLYGGLLGMVAVNQVLANMSMSGRRIAVSPTPKHKLILSGVLAGYLVQIVGLALLYVYLIFVLRIDFGPNLPLVIIVSLLGCLAGLSLGVFLASTIRSSLNFKVGLMLAVTMTGCFFAGMMGVSMKYLIDTNLPLLNRLNPANLITDGLYSLYYYDTFERLWGDIITLVIITGVIISISVWSLRKEQYDRL